MNPDLSAGTQHIFDMAKVGLIFEFANYFWHKSCPLAMLCCSSSCYMWS